jgi:hypothetical protein
LHESKSAVFLKSLFEHSDDVPVKCFPIAPPFEDMPVPRPGILSAVAGYLLSAERSPNFQICPVRTYTLFYTLKHALSEICPALYGVVSALIHGPNDVVPVHLVRKIGKDGIRICWYWYLRGFVVSGLAVSLVCVMHCPLHWI